MGLVVKSKVMEKFLCSKSFLSAAVRYSFPEEHFGLLITDAALTEEYTSV